MMMGIQWIKTKLLTVVLLLINIVLVVGFVATFVLRLLLQSLNIIDRLYIRRRYLEERLPFTEEGTTIRNKVCIIGCGPSGLVTAKECIEHGLSVKCFDKSSRIGGAFEAGYENGKFTSSKMVTVWSSFPGLNKEYDYHNYHNHDSELPTTHWTFEEYVDYLQQFVDYFSLGSVLHLNTEVMSIEKIAVSTELEGHQQNDDEVFNEDRIDEDYKSDCESIWRVVTKDTRTDFLETLIFDKVIICGGTNHVPKRPTFELEECFKGSIIHSSQYKSGEIMKGKNVLVVGLGESGSDISYQTSKYARKTLLISRKGPGSVVGRHDVDGRVSDTDTSRSYHGLPKLLFAGENAEHLPKWWKLKAWIEKQRYEGRDIFCKKTSKSDISFTRRFWMRSPGTKSSNFIKAFEANGMTYKETSIVRFHENSVELKDGEIFPCDVVVCCTGYSNDASILPSCMKNVNYRKDLWKKCIHPELSLSFAFVGFARPNFGSIPPIAELQARLVAMVMAGKLTLPSQNEMKRMMKSDQDFEEWLFAQYHEQIPTLCSYMETIQALCRLLGCDVDWKRLLQNPNLFGKIMFGPISTAQFRLFGPGADPTNAVKVLSSLPSVEMAEKMYLALLNLCAGILSNIGFAAPPVGLYLP